VLHALNSFRISCFVFRILKSKDATMKPNSARLSLSTVFSAAIVLALLAACVYAAQDDEPKAGDAKGGEPKGGELLSELERAKQRLAPSYTLAYKFQPGDEVRTKVVHLATVETKIKGVAQTSQSRTISTRLWRIKQVEPSGNIVFENIVERVEMWNSVTGRQEMRYDSATDADPPPEFQGVAASVGKVLATVTMNPHGRILSRNSSLPQSNFGIGELTIPFPQEPVKAGTAWTMPEELQVRLEDGTVKKIQTRQQYRLEKVEAGVATIGVSTQILTPVNDPKVKSQLVQRMQRGTIKFDTDAGRLLHKQMDADEEVVGFSGPESHMQYLARFTEEPAPQDDRTARAP
jgi:hypothetical protein